ncbi:hypothetical protein T440DRAFT_473154 [Plenodomus tracheiphilus IPT5]|uniref:MARVEL domain-containing protein n=1 Tax=Plenodomus tracheiphilus IPT5 TaxID=1408161 RepID=A0A6A7ARG5_9PLEO|nr:hypothetical protein T440DRAFT_473154 [Plenodomus tracheiphilus IPT5]
MIFVDIYFARIERFSRFIHIIQAILVLAAFIAGCALLADSSMPRSRSTTLILVYSIKSALFLLYQYLTKKIEKFKRFASLKAYMIMDTLDCLLWFTAFIISCMGGGRCRGSSCAVIGVAATIALLLCFTYILTSSIAIRNWRHSKLPSKIMTESYASA